MNNAIADNSGFSLVELIIAVLILSIITIPLLNLFVSSAKVNNKARKVLKATTVAQDIAEGFKAYDKEGLLREFFKTDEFGINPKDPADIVSPEDFAVISKYAIEDQGGGYVEGTLAYGMGNLSSYVYKIKGIEFENTKFNAVITVNPNPYYTHGSLFLEPGTDPNKTLNPTNISSIYSVNSGNYLPADSEIRKDGCFTIGSQVEELVLEKIIADNPSYAISTYNDVVLTGRKIDVTFKKLATDGYVQAEISMTYYYKPGKSDSVPTTPEKSVTVKNTDLGLMSGLTCKSDKENGDYSNYYIYYYPMYQYDQAVKPFDEIEFHNEDLAFIRTFLVKQQYKDSRYSEADQGHAVRTGYEYSRLLSETALHNEELNYQIKVTYNDEGRLYNTVIWTNLGKCLAHGDNCVSMPSQYYSPNVDIEYIMFNITGSNIADPRAVNAGEARYYIADMDIKVFDYDPAFKTSYSLFTDLGHECDPYTDDDILVEIKATVND